MQSDEDLMTAAAQGDLHSFEQIVLHYQASVWRVAWRYVRCTEEARDIAQVVFAKLFEARAQYKRSALLKTYLFRIVTTTCLDFVRKKRPIAQEVLPDVLDPSPQQSDIMVSDEQEKAVRMAIDNLLQRQRSAVVLRYDAELSIREIADVLKITEKAAERLLAHARTALQQTLAKICKK